MRIGLLLGAAVGLCPAVVNAQAAQSETRLISAFTGICLEHMGDPAAQVTIATAAPWGFVADGAPRENGLVAYRSGPTRLGVGANLGVCTVTGEMEPAVTLASFQSAMTAAIGTDEGRSLAADSRYWIIADSQNEEQVLSVKVSDQTGRNLATLWVQRRATVAPGNH